MRETDRPSVVPEPEPKPVFSNRPPWVLPLIRQMQRARWCRIHEFDVLGWVGGIKN